MASKPEFAGQALDQEFPTQRDIISGIWNLLSCQDEIKLFQKSPNFFIADVSVRSWLKLELASNVTPAIAVMKGKAACYNICQSVIS
jgi:hypothetical protein